MPSVLFLSAPLPEHSKTVAMMVETSLLQSGCAARRQGGCRQGWQCFVKLRHHQRGSGQLSSSIQFNIVFDNGQQLLNHDCRRSPALAPHRDWRPAPPHVGCFFGPVVPGTSSTATCSGLPVLRGPANLCRMATKSRETIYGASVRAAAERAAEARRDADRLAVEAWNKRMLSFQGPAQPSPTLGDALNALGMV